MTRKLGSTAKDTVEASRVAKVSVANLNRIMKIGRMDQSVNDVIGQMLDHYEHCSITKKKEGKK